MTGVNITRAIVVMVPVAVVLAGWQPVGALVLAAVTLAACRGSFEPAMQASLPRLSPNEAMLLSANALFDSTYRLARLVGPTLAAALVLLIPVIHLLTVQCAMALAALALVWSLRQRLPPFAATRGPTSIVTGFRLLIGHKLLRIAVGGNVIAHGTWVIVITIGIALLIDERRPEAFGLPGAGAYGLVIGAYGLGNLSGNIMAASRPRPPGIPGMFGGEILMGCGFLGVGLAGLLATDAWLLPAMACAAAIGAHGASFHDMPIALMVQRFPPHYVASVHRARMVIQQTGILAAMVVAPFFFDRFGATATILGAGAVHALVGVVAWTIAARVSDARP